MIDGPLDARLHDAALALGCSLVSIFGRLDNWMFSQFGDRLDVLLLIAHQRLARSIFGRLDDRMSDRVDSRFDSLLALILLVLTIPIARLLARCDPRSLG